MPTPAPLTATVAPVTPGRRSLGGALLVVVLVLVGLLPLAAPAGAATCDGVTVRVERAGGSAVERCVSGTPSTGLAALERAGFAYTFVPGQPGMVCTIDGHPDPCNDAPDDAYWAYWHADAGATTWTYSSRGGANRAPSPGGHEAWVFGGGMSRPPADPPPAPEPEPTPTTPSNGSGSAGSGGSGSAGSGGSGSGGSGSSSSGADRAGSSSAGSGGSASGGTSAGGSSGGSEPGSSSDRGATARDGRPEPEPDAAGGSTADGAEDRTASTDGDGADDDTRQPDASAAGEPGDVDSDPGDEVVDGDEDADEARPDGDRDRPGVADEATDGPAETTDTDDAVAIGPVDGGRSLGGLAVGGALVAGLAGAAVFRARRRDDDLGPEL